MQLKMVWVWEGGYTEMMLSSIDHFLCDITYTRKFDYYSADHTLGGQHALLMYYVQWGKPNQPTHSCA